MRCGLGRVPSCLFLRFGVVKHLSSDLCQTSLHPSRINAYSWDIQGKPWDIASTTGKRTKCLLLGTGFSLRKSFSVGRPVGGRSDSKKFEDHSGTAPLVMRSYRRH